jgi:hypothetical protein
MTIQHVDIVDPNIHEPKGVGSANSGEVYVADGLGSGAWSSPVTSIYFEFAQIYTTAQDSVSVSGIGVTPIALPFSNNGVANGSVADASNNRITLVTPGTYSISLSLSFDTASSGDSGLYKFNVLDDGTPTILHTEREMSEVNDTGSCSVAGLITVGANSQITVTVESDEGSNTDDINIYNAILSATLIQAT